MKAPARIAVGILGASAGAALVGGIFVASRFLERVRYFPTPVPGLEWKHALAFGLPFLLLAWVFVVRRGATSSLVAVATAAVLVVGHGWSNLDWTVFVARGTGLATGGTPPLAFAAVFVVPFLLVAVYHGLRRSSELRRVYAEKHADETDVAAVRRASFAGMAAILGGAALLSALVAGVMLGAVPAAAAIPLAPSQAVGVAAGAVAVVALVGAAIPRLVAWRARGRKA